jgi:hypothetical protein
VGAWSSAGEGGLIWHSLAAAGFLLDGGRRPIYLRSVRAVLLAFGANTLLKYAIRRARLMLTMLCVLTVVFYFAVLPTTLGLMVALLSVIGTVLLYLPAANRFFAPRDLPT